MYSTSTWGWDDSGSGPTRLTPAMDLGKQWKPPIGHNRTLSSKGQIGNSYIHLLSFYPLCIMFGLDSSLITSQAVLRFHPMFSPVPKRCRV